jgi:leucyl aminopeptidase
VRRVDVESSTAGPLDAGADTIATGIFEGDDVTEDAAGRAVHELVASGEARLGLGKLAVAHADGRRFVVVGLGERDRFDAERARRAAAAAYTRACEISARTLAWGVPEGFGPEIAEAIVQGTLLAAYRFDRYKPATTEPNLDRLILSSREELATPVSAAATVTEAQNRARDLGNTPSNDLPPLALAAYARELAAKHPALTVETLGGEEIRREGMGAFAAVAQGSAQEACLIRMDYDGTGGGSSLLTALVGKAITFDSGGLALKPRTSMVDMKFDMAGGAAVIEAITALAELQAPVRVLGIVGAAENLPSGTAVKPGDIVRALDGTTIEVNNPDAEGRLVLADCLSYARALGAERLVDIATLTGAIVTALGSVYAGMFSNDEAWASLVQDAAARSGEPVWRMPLDEEYADLMKGSYAQLSNLAKRTEAQAATAAEFLHHFAGEAPWVHLDIAGMAYDVPRPYFRGKGATGYGVRLLAEVALAAGVI